MAIPSSPLKIWLVKEDFESDPEGAYLKWPRRNRAFAGESASWVCAQSSEAIMGNLGFPRAYQTPLRDRPLAA
ncbi:MAG: hypothetical protein U0987_12310, partial [Afipia sp.]|nr:hypothetical protein [Afipia sp.]